MWRNANLSLNVALVRNDPHATRETARWRWIIFPCGMPACVTPQGSSHSPKGSLAYMYNVFFGPSTLFALPAAGLSSCSRLRGTQGARPDPLRKFGPWPRSVARAPGVQRGTPARGGILRTVEPSRPMQPTNIIPY